MGHGTDKDADRVSVGDRGQVVAQPDRLGIERKGCEADAPPGQSTVAQPGAHMLFDISLILWH